MVCSRNQLLALVQGSPPSAALFIDGAAGDGASFVANGHLLLIEAPARKVLDFAIDNEIWTTVDGKAGNGRHQSLAGLGQSGRRVGVVKSVSKILRMHAWGDGKFIYTIPY